MFFATDTVPPEPPWTYLFGEIPSCVSFQVRLRKVNESPEKVLIAVLQCCDQVFALFSGTTYRS